MKAGLVAAVLIALAARDGGAQRLPVVRLTTELGAIEIEVDSIKAPVTAANFLRYLDRGLYRNGLFHRTVTMDNQPNNAVKIEVIQAAGDSGRRTELAAAIPLERTSLTGLRHLAGTVSMARGGPDTAQDQFFICVTDQPELDFGGKRNPDGQGFGAFARVIRGMDVVRSIQRRPADGQRLTPPIAITAAGRVR